MSSVIVSLLVCGTLIYITHRLHDNPITFGVHHKYEQVLQPTKEPTTEEKKLIEDQEVVDGLNEVIKFTQDFLGGEPYAESKPKAK